MLVLRVTYVAPKIFPSSNFLHTHSVIERPMEIVLEVHFLSRATITALLKEEYKQYLCDRFPGGDPSKRINNHAFSTNTNAFDGKLFFFPARNCAMCL